MFRTLGTDNLQPRAGEGLGDVCEKYRNKK